MLDPKSQIQNSPLNEGWLEIGKIVSPQGLAGELRVYPNTDFPERFLQPGQRWLLRPGETEPQSIELLAGRYIEGKNLYVVEVAGIEDREQAEALRGSRFLVPEGDRPQLAEGEYHVLDLLGLKVFNQPTQEFVGTVVDVISAGNDLLEVKLYQPNEEQSKAKSQKTVLIPFVNEIVPVVDLAAKRVEIIPPPGLLEL